MDKKTQALAEMLHDILCHHNHTDGCGWFYDSWEQKPLRSVRQSYYKMAVGILKRVSYSTAVKVIKEIQKGSRRGL